MLSLRGKRVWDSQREKTQLKYRGNRNYFPNESKRNLLHHEVCRLVNEKTELTKSSCALSDGMEWAAHWRVGPCCHVLVQQPAAMLRQSRPSQSLVEMPKPDRWMSSRLVCHWSHRICAVPKSIRTTGLRYANILTGA